MSAGHALRTASMAIGAIAHADSFDECPLSATSSL
jgi:hypothetical protein